MEDTTTKYIEFEACTTYAKENMDISLSSSGKLLSVSICLRDVCPNMPIMVGVLVCYNNKPYALETKELCLDQYSCKPGCCSCSCLRNLWVEGFDFVFPVDVCRQKVMIKVVSHYIY